MTENKKIGLIILAAGASSRFGSPKQLLSFQGKTLIFRAVVNALQTDCRPVVAVLGANFDEIKKEIENLECEIVFNENWQTGMSSSIIKGLETALQLNPDLSGIIIALCDQPFIRAEDFNSLIEKFYETEKDIVASFYQDTIGVPTLFSHKIFPDLMSLRGDSGAKLLLKKYPNDVEKISVAEAAFDIDTRENFEFIKSEFDKI